MMNDVPVVERSGPILSRYEVLFCDVWGVVHDGRQAHAAAGDALARFRQAGGTVVLVSNAPVPKESVARVLNAKGVRRDAWDAIVASGDLALAYVQKQGFCRQVRIGPARNSALFDLLPGTASPVAEADAIVCTGLRNESDETVENYRDLLTGALARALPFVCANPDLVVDVGATRLLCAGSIAALYEDMGGRVYWAGKPYAPAYRAAFDEAATVRGGAIAPGRVLAIGDAARTDIAGAARAGIDSLFVAGGLHRKEVTADDRIAPKCLNALFANGTARPLAATLNLCW